MDLFDGYEDLPENDREKIKLALEQGHVDDEDWKGVSLHFLLSIICVEKFHHGHYFSELHCCQCSSSPGSC
jgi:hypothetical protein